MPETVESEREIRARVNAEELEDEKLIVVPDPETDMVVIFDPELPTCRSDKNVRFVPLPEHRREMLLDGEVCRWNLIDDMPDVALKVVRVGPACW